MEKKKIKMKKENYLDKIPVKSSSISWKTEEEKVTLEIENKGIYNRVFQKLLKKPKVSYIHLDEIGSRVWPLIDGEKSIFEIGALLKDELGERLEPLYERLSLYFNSLDKCNFITWKK